MAEILTFEQHISTEMPFRDVTRDGEHNPSMAAMAAVRERMRRQSAHDPRHAFGDRAAKYRRARGDLVEVQQADARASLAAVPPKWRPVTSAQPDSPATSDRGVGALAGQAPAPSMANSPAMMPEEASAPASSLHLPPPTMSEEGQRESNVRTMPFSRDASVTIDAYPETIDAAHTYCMTPTKSLPAPSSSVRIPTMGREPTADLRGLSYDDINMEILLHDNTIDNLSTRLKTLEIYPCAIT